MKKITFLLILFSLVSCVTIVLKSMGILDAKMQLKELKSTSNKELVFLGIHHIGTKEYYNDVKKKVDSLKKSGFVFFYESVKMDNTLSLSKQDTIKRKMRKILRFAVSSGYIKDSINPAIGKLKLDKKIRLVNQPRYFLIGVDTLKDIHADLPMNIMIEKYEKEFGEIKLSECDFSTSLNDEYQCKNVKKYNKKFLLMDLRNQYLTNKILTSSFSKIGIIYGDAHYKGLSEELNKTSKNISK